MQGADRLCLSCLAGAAAPFLSSVTFCLVTISQIERQQMIKLSDLTCIDWQCTLVDRFINEKMEEIHIYSSLTFITC